MRLTFHAFVAVLCCINLQSTWAGPLSVNDGTKATPKIIAKAKAGIIQELIVDFDVKEVDEKVKQMRRAQGLQDDQSDNQEHTLAKAKGFAEVRETIFPKGRLGDVVVTRTYKNFPTVVVSVPDIKALEQLLSHPKIKNVYESGRGFLVSF